MNGIIHDFVHIEPSLTLDTTGKWILVFSALGIKVIFFLAISLTYEFNSLHIGFPEFLVKSAFLADRKAQFLAVARGATTQNPGEPVHFEKISRRAPRFMGAGGEAARPNPDFAVTITAKIGIFRGAQKPLELSRSEGAIFRSGFWGFRCPE